MFTIALIGVGGIGFRHFQSIISMDEIALFVIDINEDALKKARDYANSNSISLEINYSVSYNNLPENIDLAILATSSIPRKNTFDALTEKHTIKNLIFEKFLFPVEAEYYEVKKIIEKKSIKAYVNCPYRLYNSYHSIKERIKGNSHIYAVVSGSYGLACNMIHYIDMVAFLLGEYGKLTCNGEQIDSEIQESKRKGYVDFSGKVVCNISNKAEIVFESFKEDGIPIRTVLFSDDQVLIISEDIQSYTVYENGKCISDDFEIEYQSGLTSRIVEQLMDKGDCSLSEYNDVMDWHIEMLRMFQKKYCDITGSENNFVPIT